MVGLRSRLLISLLFLIGSSEVGFTAHAEDCTDAGMRAIEKVRTTTSDAENKPEALDKISAAYEELKATVFQPCFDPKIASQKDIMWDYYVDFPNKTMAFDKIISSKQSDIDFYLSHGNLAAAERVRQNYVKTYEKFGASPPVSYTQPLTDQGHPNCSDVNIADQLPPVRDQGEAGWCTSFSFADLLSFKMKETVSAAYLGMLLRGTGDGGVGFNKILTVNQLYGFCKESTLPSTMVTSSGFQASLAKINSSASGAACSINDVQALFPASAAQTIATLLQTLPSEKLLVLDPAISLNQYDPKEFVSDPAAYAALKACESDRQTMKVKDLQFVSSSDSKKDLNLKLVNLDTMDEGLNSGKPVRFGYDYDQLANKGAGGAHSSVIVGRRFINGKCEYLVRNSWGTSSCTKVVPEDDACQPPGHYWVDSDKLEASTFNADYIK